VSFLCSTGNHEGNRWSILAFDARETIQDIEQLKSVLKPKENSDLPFSSGVIGYVSYDYGLKFYDISPKGISDPELPDIFFRYYDQAVLYDHVKDICYFASEEHDDSFVLGLWSEELSEPEEIAPLDFQPTITRDEYDKAFKRVKQHIIDGDVYQLNLTHRLEAGFKGSSADLFVHLSKKNPAPMSVFIKGDGFDIISCSPERFLTLDGDRLSTFPIKGTAKSDSDERELLEDEKEQAELNMITDLLRNDIGMVSKIGTVKVEKHREIMGLASVMHTYSHISGQKRSDLTPLDAFLKMFPGGSITGCPKKRAMEIINELEKYSRSIYTGCIGYISNQGSIDFNIAIRTLVKKGDKLYLGVGGGIVADSGNELEYTETLHKARGFL
jgi:anthranilate/para-aminobenzoate synthase component I